jgi:hypothetical protein
LLALGPDRIGYDTNETAAEVPALAVAYRALKAVAALWGTPGRDWAPHRTAFASELRSLLQSEHHDLTSPALLKRLCLGCSPPELQ